MKRYVSIDSRREALKPRCCAKCKTPFNCGNTACDCHKVQVAEPPYYKRKAARR